MIAGAVLRTGLLILLGWFIGSLMIIIYENHKTVKKHGSTYIVSGTDTVEINGNRIDVSRVSSSGHYDSTTDVLTITICKKKNK